MADTAPADLGELSPSQQEALQQYTAVTNQDVAEAIPLLRRSQWNVQIAITKFFDGEGHDPVAEAIAAQSDIPRAAARHENLHESLLDEAFEHAAQPPAANQTDVAPRVVPPPPTTWTPPFLLAVLLTPLRLGYRVAATLLRSVLYVLSFLPQPIRPTALLGGSNAGLVPRGWRQGGGSSGGGGGSSNTNGRRALMPRDTAARFRREFEEQYGAHALPFFDGGAAQAQDAAKRDLKFLLMVLLSPEHDDTDAFVADTLLSPLVVDFINDPANNIVLWGGNVQDSEAFQVALEYSCTKFPFSALVCLTPKEGSTRMGIVKRLAGPLAPAAYVAALQAAIAKYAPDLDGVRAERAAHEVARSLRSEQDSAYERSLARDRERARARREAEAATAAAEKAAQEEKAAAALREEKRMQWRRWRAVTVAPEPAAGDGSAVRLALNMPSSAGGRGGAGAGRVVRWFDKTASLEDLYAFVECYDLVEGQAASEKTPEKPDNYEHTYAFRIASLMPREVLDPDEKVTIGDKIGRGGNLIVEEILHGSDDGHED